MEVVKLEPKKDEGAEKAKKDVLDVLRNLISKVEEGKIVGVIALGFARDNATGYRWQCLPMHSNLEALGSLEMLKQTFIKEEFK